MICVCLALFSVDFRLLQMRSMLQPQLIHPFNISGLPRKTLLQHSVSSTITSELNRNDNIEIRVCTSKSCRRQGSMTTLDTLLGIAPPYVSVSSCGCLSRCGAGPNLVVLPQAAIASHCGTPARTAEVMAFVCAPADADAASRSLQALALRKRAELEFQTGNLGLAESLYSQAIEAKPVGGIHIAYKGRSAVRLASGNFAAALEDANEALVLAPRYAQAYISQGDAFVALDLLNAAEKSYTMALQTDPSVRTSKSFKARVKLLEEKMSPGAMP